MQIDSLKFRGKGCFVADWAGFPAVLPINVIIGRNNTGKSQLLELVRISCTGIKQPTKWEFHCTGTLQEQALRGQFLDNHSGGDLGGGHWTHHGQWLVDVPIEWDVRNDGGISNLKVCDSYSHSAGIANETLLTPARMERVERIVKGATCPLQGKDYRHLLADRDIRPEKPTKDLSLSPDGSGATNIIRRLITSASADMPRELVQHELRNALNEIFASDGTFTEIQVQQHDSDDDANAAWEVFLGEERKGLVALSQSGSGLKTVILVLLHLLVLPKIKGMDISAYVFAFEELENNLHPALLRRLLQFIEKLATESQSTVFLTTHSSTALDLFGTSPNAQIVHVTHDGTAATSTPVEAHFSRIGIVGELGAKPSDLLQANGIVWVEGPSDAIYLSKWIDMGSNGSLREGRDYLCAFYGGALLARTQFASPEVAMRDLVNLLLVNPNVALVCDSDRKNANGRLKPRLARIRSEMANIPGAVMWVTDTKEIENYLPGDVISGALNLSKPVRSPQRYETFFPVNGRTDSYVETVLNRRSIDKIELATRCSQSINKDALEKRFDFSKRLAALIAAIQRWNR